MIHKFQPKIYYNAFGTYKPALKVSDGDTIITSTVDNAGRDSSDKQVAKRGNPLTGPFYVEGAEPGDTLAVHLRRLWPNRRIGRSSARIAPHILDAEYINEHPMKTLTVEWEIDLEKGTARPLEPKINLGEIILPLNPMLGCLGVAPPREQAISSATSGRYGGNMDYKGITSGVTVYFPVFVEGALLFLGDGHAIQGDGEILGTGIEVSFDVEFSVNLLKNKKITWPRAENDKYIMTIGNARPLDQALQHATTEMIRWLKEDYGLDGYEAHTLLGHCIEYEIGNVYDPAYTVVCKLKKKWLNMIRRRDQK